MALFLLSLLLLLLQEAYCSDLCDGSPIGEAYKGRLFERMRINSSASVKNATGTTVYGCHQLCLNHKCIALSFSEHDSLCKIYNATRIQHLLVDDPLSTSIIVLPISCTLDTTVDGGWSSWSELSECSHRCGEGVAVRNRSCTSPLPACNGNLCSGNHLHSVSCNHCPALPAYIIVLTALPGIHGSRSSSTNLNGIVTGTTEVGMHVVVIDMMTGLETQRNSFNLVTQGRSTSILLLQYIQGIHQGQMVLLHTHDDASYTAIHDLTSLAYSLVGANEITLHFRDCFCFIGCTSCGPAFPYVKEHHGDGMGDCECVLDQMIHPAEQWHDVRVGSKSQRNTDASKESSCYVNGDRIVLNSPGINVVHVDRTQGELIVRGFGHNMTSASTEQSLENYIDDMLKGTMVLISVHGSAVSNITHTAVNPNHISHLGSTTSAIDLDTCYCLIGCKDCGKTFPYVEMIGTTSQSFCNCQFEGILML